MQTIEIDDETFAKLEAFAKQEHASFGSVIKRAIHRLPAVQRPAVEPSPIKVPHGYKIPVSKGVPFTMADVWAVEDDNDLRGLR